jgi:hypothetical protein
MLATRPLLSGSVTDTNTTGMVRDSRCNASDIPEPDVMMTLGAERTSSAGDKNRVRDTARHLICCPTNELNDIRRTWAREVNSI